MVAVVVIAVGFLVFSGSKTEQPMTYSEAKAKTNNPAMCLAENTALTVNDTETLTNIQMVVMSQLTDVPAGTKTDIRFATYDGNAATGSEKYEGDYGSYNFTVKKDTAGTWRVSTFALCTE